jgi:YVTN family beta-propeller protein
VVNTQNLSYQLVPIGSNPIGLALSADASKLYVANSGSSFIGVMDTQTLTALNPILVPGNYHPSDVAVGTNNRLFVLANGIQQVDATTGATAGPNVTGLNIYGGTMEISPDRSTLWYGQQGLSPTTLYKINASSASPSAISSISTGSNGRDVALNHSGSAVAHPNGAPYAISLLRTSDLATLGTLNTGAYPYEIAFSPDDLVAYTYADTGGIKTYSTSSFLSIGPTITNGVGNEMIVDSSGRYLFASSSVTTVYDTGRSVPEPIGLSLFALAAPLAVSRREKSRGSV